MPLVDSNRREPARRSLWIPWLFVAFFGIVVAANATMITVAVTTFTGIGAENQHSYQQGLAYNDTIAAVAAQKALGWDVDLTFDPSGGRRGVLDLSMMDAHGGWIDQAAVSVQLRRPTEAAADFSASLPYVRDGHYRATLDFPLPGIWDVHIDAEDARGTYRLTQRVFVK